MALPGTLPQDSRGRVLIVHRNDDVVDLLSTSLSFRGFEIDTASDAAEAFDRVYLARPAAVILDVELRDMHGIEVLRRLRADGVDSAVLLVTGREALQDRITGLNAGADDCLSRPFGVDELIARLDIVLRRTAPRRVTRRLVVADLEVDEQSRTVTRAGVPVPLSPTEFTLLQYLVIKAGTVVSRQDIVDYLSRHLHVDKDVHLDSHMSHLRHKVDVNEEDSLIHTVRGLGYVLRQPHAHKPEDHPDVSVDGLSEAW
ncbi:DNA-binding response regulator [Mycolicibacterium madagascariense]|uniref:DNA-binding response regulator n=1 Tax=Mycolicibacterium madagascariense TaxID=212765 RepID=A0A7I7XJ84_9MYCO|nr:response regulator transcription factor [Mycolicibacterium madagascariense]MCV7013818.1 response regulator transcription factor [Mycolicibacterium madagascariense]BBZ29276.1 DNA-binding response regulator [Mycolicibacterium madagascariense]